jgi:hypothetical protein
MQTGNKFLILIVLVLSVRFYKHTFYLTIILIIMVFQKIDQFNCVQLNQQYKDRFTQWFIFYTRPYREHANYAPYTVDTNAQQQPQYTYSNLEVATRIPPNGLDNMIESIINFFNTL